MRNRAAFPLAVLLGFFSSRADAVEVGVPAPACALRPFSEAPEVLTAQLIGKVVVIDFWASWCGPCAKSFPFLNELVREHRDDAVHVLGVNMDEHRTDAEGFLKRHPNLFQIATDVDAQCAKAFGVKAMPSSYVIDKKGFVRAVVRGFQASDAKTIRERIEYLLKE